MNELISVLAVPNAVWSAEGSLNDDYNKYYDDTGEGGGYNNLELMRYNRTYTLGLNKKGDLAIPMKQTHDWLRDQVTQ